MYISSVYAKRGISLFILIILFFLPTIPASSAAIPITSGEGNLKSPFTEVYEKVAPSVVKITIQGEVESRSRFSPWFFTPQDEKRPYWGMGSGVIVDREGHILTNNHVIMKPDQSTVADEIIVILNDNEEYKADVIGRDPETDLAVVKLRLDGKILPEEYVAELGDSDSVKPGDYAIAIGNPLGLERTITVGVISAVGRYKDINPRGAEELKFKNFIQTDAQINPGNSGGALLNIQGHVIGINDMYIAQYAGIGFAIPINLARNVMKQIIETGVVKRGAIGIQIGDITKEFQEALELPTREGVFIHEVLPGTPAEKADLKKSDVIVSLNGKKMNNSNEFLLEVGDLPPGENIILDVIQDGQQKSVTLTLMDRDTIKTVSTVTWRGIHVVDIGSSQAQQFNIDDIDSGVVVINISTGSPADETSLEPGDVIVEINDETVNNVRDFIEIRDKYATLKRPVLIYRLRRLSNGEIWKGFVAVKSE